MIIIKKTEDHLLLHLPLHRESHQSILCAAEYRYPRFVKNLDYYLGEQASHFDDLTPDITIALKEKGYQICAECENLVKEYVENRKKWDEEIKQNKA